MKQKQQDDMGSVGFNDRLSYEEALRVPLPPPCVADGPPDGYDREPMELPVLRYPHPALRRPCADVERFDEGLRRLAKNLFRTMYEEDDGVGLAAPQVGVNLRLMVYNPTRAGRNIDPSGETVLVNPRIVARSDDAVVMQESCLSFPGLHGTVLRPTWIEVDALDLSGQPHWSRRRLEGLEARLFQHEYDHLEGVLYVDHLDERERERVQPSLDKLGDEFAAAGGNTPAF